MDYVELYPVQKRPYELRVPVRVSVYDLIPRTYTSSHWIRLAGTGDEFDAEGNESSCASRTSDIHHGRPMRGKVLITGEKARLDLEEPQSENGMPVWRPYRFNGEYRLVRPDGTRPRFSLADVPEICHSPNP